MAVDTTITRIPLFVAATGLYPLTYTYPDVLLLRRRYSTVFFSFKRKFEGVIRQYERGTGNEMNGKAFIVLRAWVNIFM